MLCMIFSCTIGNTEEDFYASSLDRKIESNYNFFNEKYNELSGSIEAIYNKKETTHKYCIIDNEKITVMWRNSGKNIAVSFAKKGVNKIFDVLAVYYNEAEVFDTEISNYTLFINNTTDYLSPIVVKAENNVDGDLPESNHFTGGNHGYNNTGETSNNSATGTSENIEFYIDGYKKDSYIGYFNYIEISWIDKIQATNTKKADGSGRYVLEEHHKITFDNVFDGFEITTFFYAKEKITITTLYGLQCAYLNSFDTISFVGSHSNKKTQAVKNGLISDRNTEYIKLNGNLNVEFGVTSGLSDGYYEKSYDAFTSGNKAYLYLINPASANKCTLDFDEYVFYKGYYKFN